MRRWPSLPSPFFYGEKKRESGEVQLSIHCCFVFVFCFLLIVVVVSSSQIVMSLMINVLYYFDGYGNDDKKEVADRCVQHQFVNKLQTSRLTNLQTDDQHGVSNNSRNEDEEDVTYNHNRCPGR